MLNFLRRDRWSPYFVGLCLALISVASFFFFHHMLGTSSVFVKLAGAFWRLIDPEYLNGSVYFKSYLDGKAWIDWQGALVIGLFTGAYLAGKISKDPSASEPVPQLWKENIGDGRPRRYIGAFIGGVLILLGARLAGGCTSGHGISGGMQLAVSSWVFMLGLFAVGIPTALLIYRKRG
ncbi:MAG: YeeE/YedE family protein [Candidatus Melainabacteria bacterium]|nr:YeeE/YedE family protein [Candidatus Melainabacteria bacterium]